MIIKKIVETWKETTNEIKEERAENEFDSAAWEKTRKEERILMEGLARYASLEEKETLKAAFSSFEKAFFNIKWDDKKFEEVENKIR